MPVTRNISTMTAKISNEIRSTLADNDIRAKIFEAIDAYKHEAFFFNAADTTFNLVAGTSKYNMDGITLPADILHIEAMNLLYGTRPIPVLAVDPKRIFQDSTITTRSLPVYYSQRGNVLWFYPVPNSAYQVSIMYTKDINTLDETSATTSTNAWFSDGERLIRNFAKALLYGELLRNAAEEDRCIGLASRAYLDLKRKSTLKTAGWTPSPWEI